MRHVLMGNERIGSFDWELPPVLNRRLDMLPEEFTENFIRMMVVYIEAQATVIVGAVLQEPSKATDILQYLAGKFSEVSQTITDDLA